MARIPSHQVALGPDTNVELTATRLWQVSLTRGFRFSEEVKNELLEQTGTPVYSDVDAEVLQSKTHAAIPCRVSRRLKSPAEARLPPE